MSFRNFLFPYGNVIVERIQPFLHKFVYRYAKFGLIRLDYAVTDFITVSVFIEQVCLKNKRVGTQGFKFDRNVRNARKINVTPKR